MDSEAAAAKPVSAVFRWCDINMDEILNEDEYLLYTHKINDPTWLFALEKDLDFTEEGASAVLNIADDDMNGLLNRNELMAHFTHFVVPRGGGSGSRQMHGGRTEKSEL